MTWKIVPGDALEILRTLDPESVQCCVTSPPYWGLRDYGTATWEGGDPACDHLVPVGGAGKSTLGEASGGHAISTEKQRQSQERQRTPARDECPRCGAKRTDHQLGLERTPDEYVARMVEVFREVRRVLRKDGTLWLNVGDSYASSPPGNKTRGLEKWATSGLAGARSAKYCATLDASVGMKRNTVVGTLKPKDLVGIPWRLAFALQADGWWLRSDIIWSKPNPMPESVTDRPTKAHEYLFLLSKSARYYYDAAAIAEPSLWASDPRNGNRIEYDAKRNGSEGEGQRAFVSISESRNSRSVWTIATQPFKEAHFATFPPELARRCIAAGTKPGDTVLDPFAGAGTTLLVADRLVRHGVGIELNPKYVAMAERRLRGDAPLFAANPNPTEATP